MKKGFEVKQKGWLSVQTAKAKTPILIPVDLVEPESRHAYARLPWGPEIPLNDRERDDVLGVDLTPFSFAKLRSLYWDEQKKREKAKAKKVGSR